MASPIRWDNVDVPSMGGAGLFMQNAQSNFGAAADGLRNLLKDQETAQTTMIKQQRDQNTSDALAKILGYGDTKSFDAAAKEGLLQQLTGINAPIDEMAVMRALDSRRGVLQNRDVADINYTNTMADNAQAGLRDGIAAKIYRGDAAGAAADIQAHPELRNTAPLYQALQSSRDAETQRERGNLLFDNQMQLAPLQRRLMAANADLVEAKSKDPDLAALSGSGGKKADGSSGSSKVMLTPDEARAELKKGLIAAGSVATEGSNEPLRNLKDIQEYVDGNVKDKDTARAFMKYYSGLANAGGLSDSKGNKVMPPLDVFKAAMLAASDSHGWTLPWLNDTPNGRFYVTDENLQDNLEKQLRLRMDNPKYRQDMKDRATLESLLPDSNAAQQLWGIDKKVRVGVPAADATTSASDKEPPDALVRGVWGKLGKDREEAIAKLKSMYPGYRIGG